MPTGPDRAPSSEFAVHGPKCQCNGYGAEWFLQAIRYYNNLPDMVLKVESKKFQTQSNIF